MIKAVSDRIVLIPEPVQEQVNGIYIPDTSLKKPQKGTVVSVGESCKEIKIGYEVWFLENHGVRIEDKLIITEKDVLGYLSMSIQEKNEHISLIPIKEFLYDSLSERQKQQLSEYLTIPHLERVEKGYDILVANIRLAATQSPNYSSNQHLK